jgi:hypothetical protein
VPPAAASALCQSQSLTCSCGSVANHRHHQRLRVLARLALLLLLLPACVRAPRASAAAGLSRKLVPGAGLQWDPAALLVTMLPPVLLLVLVVLVVLLGLPCPAQMTRACHLACVARCLLLAGLLVVCLRLGWPRHCWT